MAEKRGKEVLPGAFAFIWVGGREAMASSLDPRRKENGGVCARNTHRRKQLPPAASPRGTDPVLALTQGVEGSKSPRGRARHRSATYLWPTASWC